MEDPISPAVDRQIETPTATPRRRPIPGSRRPPFEADPFGAAASPALPARAEGSPSVSVPPANTPADPWSQQPAAPAAEAPGAPANNATGARKLRKKLAALTGMHHAGARLKEKAKEKLAKKPRKS